MSKTLLLCTGKACRKKKGKCDELLFILDKSVVIRPVRCQKICGGPVIGLKLGGQWEWFKKLRRSREIVAVARTMRRGKIVASLKKLHVKKRSGKLRS